MFSKAATRSFSALTFLKPSRVAPRPLTNHTRPICHLRVATSFVRHTTLPLRISTTPRRHFSYGFTLSQPYLNDAARTTSFADPDRPELFYHLFHPPTSISETTPVFALSFISEAPPTVDSCAVLGWLPAAASEEGEAGLNDFRENGTSLKLSFLRVVVSHFSVLLVRDCMSLTAKFVDVLHEAIQSALHDGVDEDQINAAIQTQQGWMHIHGSVLPSPRLRISLPHARSLCFFHVL